MTELRDIEAESALDAAAEEFFQAAYKYREFLKRHAPDRLYGVVAVFRDHECLVHSEMGKYTDTIKEMSWDRFKDEITFQSPSHPNDREDDESDD